MKLTLSTLRKTYRLKNIVRYNTWSKISNESVAEHSYYVVLFTMLLCKELEVNKEIADFAIKLAIVHDLPEIVTNDITYDAKQAMPEINEILTKYEDIFYKDNFGNYEEIFSNIKSVSIASTIVKMADVISAMQYCDNEVQLGNTKFEDMYDSNQYRLLGLKNTLEKEGISCQKIII